MNWGYERDGRATKEKAKKAHGWSRVRKCVPSTARWTRDTRATEGFPKEIDENNARMIPSSRMRTFGQTAARR